MPDLHVLGLPSWYPTLETPLDGVFFKEQFQALHNAGVRVGVVYPQIRTIKKLGWGAIRKSHFQSSFVEEGGLPVGRLYGWNLIPYPRRIGGFFRIWLTELLVKQYIARFGRPDLLHAHSVLWGGIAAAEVSRKLGLPYVITEHSSAFFQGKVGAHLHIQSRRAFTGARRVITVSHALGRYLVENHLAAAEQVCVIPNMVDTDFFTPPPARARPRPFRFLCVAIFSPVKQIDLLLTAFAQAFAGADNVLLDIGGDGPERLSLEILAQELGIASRVTFLGPLNRAEVREAMWRAHTLVSASFYETFGVTLIEALATGLPVVSTASGGPDDIVSPDVGRLTPVDDVEALARALQWARHAYPGFDPAQLRNYALSRFSRQQIARQIIDLYQEILAC